jgi:arylsulfatase A-like enzyme
MDQPVGALLTDLKARGLLDSTLVVWGGEFGRASDSQGAVGRDHNPHAPTIWLAGGGIRSGVHYGATDDFGYKAVEHRTSVHDIQATVLHLLGLDHTRLTYRFNGRDFRLTDLAGTVVRALLS